jgi:hypothetical protein
MVLEGLVLHVAAGLQASLTLPDGVPPLVHLNVKGCYVVKFPAYFFIWIPPLAFETILYVLMVYRVWRLYTDDYGNPLLKVLIRDRCV